MSMPAHDDRQRAPAIRLHKIPSPRSEPYICMRGPDGALWFCESGASKIGRLDVDSKTFAEFDIPSANAMPIGITPGADGNMWFCAKKANAIGRITMRGDIVLFAVPTPNAGPDGTLLGPDGNVWFSKPTPERSAGSRRMARSRSSIRASRPARARFRLRPATTRWFTEAAGNRASAASRSTARSANNPIPGRRQPAARAGGASRRLAVVRRDQRERARPRRRARRASRVIR